MPFVALAIPFLTPLLLAPHFLFYYDITPKVAILLLGGAAALLLTARDWDSLAAFCGTLPGRWFAFAAAASLSFTALATFLSSHRELAWNGSNWRRMGAVTEFAILLAATLIAAHASRSRDRLVQLLRAICAAGIVTSLYGIAQYFGWDPMLPAAQYHVGEGIYQIVRPPSTLGHSDYFAAFLVWPVFTGIALFRTATVRERTTQLLSATAALTSIIAILLSGSRGAALALIAGFAVLIALRRPSFRAIAAAITGAVLILAIFYVSPAGERLRARVHWIGEEPAGGARLLLWYDSIKMVASRPLTGFGPDNFVAEFPHFQSIELERAYPDFYNESPHNLILDSLTSEGALGFLALTAIVVAAVAGALRARQATLVAALLPAFAAALLAHQFIVFTSPNAFFFYLGAALLAGAGASEIQTRPAFPSKALRYSVLAAACIAAALFCIAAYRLVSVDAALATVQRRLDDNDPRDAAEAYHLALSRPTAGLSADLYFSRRFANVAVASSDFESKLYYSQIAAGAASLATRLPEDRQNAWYNMALLAAGRRDPAGVESCLRNAIAAAPVWYKPHWTLARLLASQSRSVEAAEEARQALDLNGGKDPEVASTLAEIIRSHAPPP